VKHFWKRQGTLATRRARGFLSRRLDLSSYGPARVVEFVVNDAQRTRL
jgi:hypothetical protein